YFIAHREEADIKKNELGFTPMPMAKTTVNKEDSSVTSVFFGLGKKKAIFRSGVGCTLLNDVPESTVRAQKIFLSAEAPRYNDTVSDIFLNKKNTPDSLYTNVARAVEPAFGEKDSSRLIRTRAVIVIHNGQLIYEKYASGFDSSTPMMGWSMAKSFTGALIGILSGDGKININDPAPIAAWKDPKDPRHAITIKNLLQQTSGLKFIEDYTKPSEATNMLFRSDDMAGFTASLDLETPPGSTFRYTSGNTNLLMQVIRNVLPESQYQQFPYTRLFHRIGMYHTVIEKDGSGNYVGSSYVYATARDYARFGLLYYNNGKWNGEQILPEGWVQQSVQRGPSTTAKQYGYQFYLNAGMPSDPKQRTCPDVPADMYNADGFEGQDIFIIPSRKLVVVRLGLTQGRYFDDNEFLSRILQALHDK
ncbi:MAG TPA: serine hydrolase, partial [Flavitalea sp.]|nr:serine hydrolase [Flavitalea sp.]